MDKPNTLRDLLAAGHISLTDVRNVAREIFDGKTTAIGPLQGGISGYVLTASQFNDLPEHVQGFVIKAILAFGVENVLDAEKPDYLSRDSDDAADHLDPVDTDGNPVEPDYEGDYPESNLE